MRSLSGMGRRHRLWLLINRSAAVDEFSIPRSPWCRGEDSGAAARKTPGRIATADRGAKNKNLKRQPVKAPPAPSPGFLIVGIGASAGGLEAMEEFFHHMPPSNGMGFVLVSHQHAGHVSLLPSLLSRCTTMPVVEATDGVEVEPDRVYL